MITIDGSAGEGGGQILRSALALSLVTGQPFRISNIRAGRTKPGLRRQHLAAVVCAERVGGAAVEGAGLGSPNLVFRPLRTVPGRIELAVGSAGSTILVLQTVLPALLLASGASLITLEGGTHNPFAPPFEFLDLTFIPLLNRMGANVTAKLVRHGFFPAGGGRVVTRIEPAGALHPIVLSERGPVQEVFAQAMLSNLPEHIGLRELKVLAHGLGLNPDQTALVTVEDSPGAGNVVQVRVRSAMVTEVFTAFGQRGIRAETVAAGVLGEVKNYLGSGVPVGTHLADQLLLPLALAGGGCYRTERPSRHALTNKLVIQQFLETPIEFREVESEVWEVTVGGG